jgi:hypothetical protein
MTDETFACIDCGKVEKVNHEGATGYANVAQGLICYACCAERDKKEMIEKGRITLYLTCEPAHVKYRSCRGKVTNWPGTLVFPCATKTGNHNIARVRYDCWFKGPDGYWWHGVQCGDNTQLCHCRRTNKMAHG